MRKRKTTKPTATNARILRRKLSRRRGGKTGAENSVPFCTCLPWSVCTQVGAAAFLVFLAAAARARIISDLRFWGNRGDSCRKSSFPRPSRASQRRRARYSSDGAEASLRRPWCIVSAAERYFTETADLKPYSFFAILLPAFGPNLFFLLLAEPPWHRRRPY